MLRAYVNDYLTEEIQSEGLVRNLSAFARFMELVGFTNNQMLNYSNIARDCGIDAKTIKAYYQILSDTLVGYLIYPFHKKIKRELIKATPKFYLFDVGVASYLKGRTIKALKGDEAGDAFEHFILMELIAYLGLHELDIPVQYWRSKNGLEVDFVLNHGKIAIEVKIGTTPHSSDLTGLRVFCEDYKPAQAIVVCQAAYKRIIELPDGVCIQVLPWRQFFENLWNGEYLEHGPINMQ
jgi:predicted AAA+ superfamily ATPase